MFLLIVFGACLYKRVTRNARENGPADPGFLLLLMILYCAVLSTVNLLIFYSLVFDWLKYDLLNALAFLSFVHDPCLVIL